MNQINPMKLLQLKGAWEQFKMRHPRLPAFLNAVSKSALAEGTVLEMTVTNADGKKYTANLKLTKEDVQLIRELKDMASGS